MVHVLLRRTKNNVLLLGDPGVGKTAIAEGIAQAIVAQGNTRLANKRLISLDVAGLLAGTQYRGTFEERVHGILDEVQQSRGSVMLFIDEVHNLVGAGAVEGALDAANMLKPALARGTLHCIGATTHEEFERHIARDAALARRFQPLPVPEPTPAEALAILQGLQRRYEAFHAVSYTPAALERAVACAVQYASGRRLPDSAVDIIDEAAAFVSSLAPHAAGATGAAQQRRINAANATDLRAFSPTSHDRPPTGGRRVAALPKACPHCGYPVPDVGTTSLFCTECSSAFLNIPQHLLMLGASVMPQRRPAAKAAAPATEKTASATPPAPGVPPGGEVSHPQHGSGPGKEAQSSGVHGTVVGTEAVLQVVSAQAGIPVGQLRGDPAWFAELREGLQAAVLGQGAAIRAVVRAVKRAHARALQGDTDLQAGGLAGGARGRRAPALLLQGPSGTGKTLLCRAVSAQLFPDAASVLWLDMAQFASPGAQAQLFGPPPGTVGHAEGGILTRLLRRHRRALVVLESLDRAHPDAQGLLASMLRRGSLQDGTRSLDCTHLWLVGTVSTGLGQEGAAGGGTPGGGLREILRSAMEASVGFEDLQAEVLQQIAQRGLEQLAQRWWVRHGLRLSWGAGAVAGVAAGKACVGPDAEDGGGGAARGELASLAGLEVACAGHAVEQALEGIESCCWAHFEREEVTGLMHVSVQGDLLRCSVSEGAGVDMG